MTLSDIILNKGEVLLSQIIIEYIILDNSPYLYGNVEKANDLSDMYAKGDKVMFDADNATKFTVDGGYYYLVKEDDVYSTFINI